MNIGSIIDGMADIDQEINVLEAAIRKLKKKRSGLEVKLMGRLEKQRIAKASGLHANAALSTRKHLSIKQTAKFNAYVLKHKALDLFQRRLNAKAYFDRLEAGDSVPGVEIYERHFVKITPKRS